MPKKMTKTTEQITEEFFAAEREEYEKRVLKAFHRVPVKVLEEKLDDEPVQAESGDKPEEAQKPARKVAN